MPEENKITDPKADNPENTQDPSQTKDGKSTIASTENQDDLPEQFKGKSAKEIATSYIELQKKIGEQSGEIKNARTAQEEIKYWRALGQIIESDPVLFKAIQGQITKQSGKETKDPGKETKQIDPETRVATGNLLYDKFEKQVGLDKLSEEKQEALRKKIGTEIARLLDPRGLKPVKEILDSIPLDVLPTYLETGYKLATDGDREERARAQALLEQRRNNDAIFSDMPNAGTRNTRNLTPEQKAVAAKMKISEEDYLKNLEE